MRVSTSTINSMATGSISNSYSKYLDVLNKINSGKNFTKVSQNVPDATKVLKLDNQLNKLNDYQDNIKAATNEMNLAYDVLGDITEQLNGIDSLILEASNASTTPESAKAIKTSIQSKLETIVDKMNSKYMDNYIFSGTFTEHQAYVINDDGTISYNGSPTKDGARNLTISEGTTFTYNQTGESILGEDGADSFFSQMKELTELLDQDKLDYTKIREKLDIVDKTRSNVINTQGTYSAKVSKLDTTLNINSDTINTLTGDKADLEEIDIVKLATDLSNAMTNLQASYQVGTTVLSSASLLDYI